MPDLSGGTLAGAKNAIAFTTGTAELPAVWVTYRV
jgi:hypothetical protein